MYAALQGNLTLAATGDSLITQRVARFREIEFLRLVERIRASDIAFTNLEVVVRREEGFPQAESGGTWVWAEPEVVNDLRWMGFEIVSVAQNHMLDWGHEGLIATLQYLQELELTFAGAGRNLADARRPAYHELSNGRVALVACTTTFQKWNRAGESRPDCPGRPGVNGLRIRRVIEVPQETLSVLRHLNDVLGLDAKERLLERLGFMKPLPEGSIYFLGEIFRSGPEVKLNSEVDAADAEGMFSAIREARRQADWVLVSIHCHEMDGCNIEAPPQFLIDFARACVEAGADVVLGHGPHVLRGIELYLGKPIFYSLGNFIFQNETLKYQPADSYEALGLTSKATPADLFDARNGGGQSGFSDPRYWESVLAVCHWREKRLVEIELYPVTLGYGLPRSIRGRPLLADADAGRSIISRLDRLSQPFGVRIDWDEGRGCGIVRGTKR